MKETLNKKEYRKILERLPIENPKPEDMAAVCPHLTMEQAITAFGKGSGYVACPPLRVKGAFQIVSYHKYEGHPPRLDWSFTCRTVQSYADLQSHGDLFSEYEYMVEAIKFAEDNWGDELVLDTWDSVLELRIQDPSELISIGYKNNQPKTKAILYVALNRDLNEIINDHSRPESQLFDDAIVEMTIDDMVWHELKGGRPYIQKGPKDCMGYRNRKI